MDRDAVAERLSRFFAADDNKDVVLAYLFGSLPRGHATGNSDIDIAVLFDPTINRTMRLARRIEITRSLEDLLDRRIDLVDLEQMPPHFNHHVLRDKVIIKGHHSAIRIQFETAVRRQYFDMLPYRQRYVAASLKRLREGGDSHGVGRADQGTLAAARRIHQRLNERADHKPR